MPQAPSPSASPSQTTGKLTCLLSMAAGVTAWVCDTGCVMHRENTTASMEIAGESEYVVFAPKPSSIEQVRGGSWGWDEEEASAPQVPDWNPRTGFMGSAAEREASGAAASTSEAKSKPAPAAVEVKALLFTAPVEGDAALPSVSKDQVCGGP